MPDLDAVVSEGIKAYRQMLNIARENGIRIAKRTGLPDMRHVNSGNDPSPHRERILALVKAKCLTYSEIGNRVGLSRERVRQIAKQAGYCGRERVRSCTLERHAIAEEEYVASLFPELRDKCQSLGLSFTAIPHSHGEVVIGGFRCDISVIKKDRNRSKQTRSPMGTIKKPTEGCEFSVSKQIDGCWYIVPATLTGFAASRNRTSRYMDFCLSPLDGWIGPHGYRRKGGSNSTMADKFRSCKEAWNLLGAKPYAA